MKAMLCGLLALAIFVVPAAAAHHARQSQSHSTSLTQPQTGSVYTKLPLSFVPNRGQMDKRVRYAAQAGGASFFFTSREAVFSFVKQPQAPKTGSKAVPKAKKGLVLRLGFTGANRHARATAQGLKSGKVNYLIGNDRTRWHRNVPTYGQIVYRNLWPGIDLRFRGANGRLKYEFLVRPAARVGDIRLAYRGATRLSVDREGALVIHTTAGRITDTAPVSYQQIGGRRVGVASRFVVRQGGYRLSVGTYNPARALVIDPGLVYSTYLGGSDDDAASGIAVDSAGQAYVTGLTASVDFPTTAGAYDRIFNGEGLGGPYGRGDVFVTKLNRSGTALVYSTYIGGRFDEPYFGGSIAVDSSGRAYITGTTWSDNYPTTPGAFDESFNGPLGTYNGFVTKLNSSGSALAYSSFLGGSAYDGGYLLSGITVDSAGKAYVTGFTDSADFPTTPGAYDRTYNNGGPYDPFAWDAFVTKFNSSGSGLVYSTYLGGTTDDDGTSIAVDSGGRAYVTGYTQSTDFPTTSGAYQSTNGGYYDAFITKLNSSGSGLVYSTYLGGLGYDNAVGIKVDSSGKAYLAGGTDSANFDTTPGAYDTTLGGPFDGFVTKLNSSGSGLVYSTYLGGMGDDATYAVAIDPAGQAHVTGYTASPTDFPTTPNAYQSAHQGGYYDGFVTKLNSNGNGLVYSTYLGGMVDDISAGIALDWAGNVYVTGWTNSMNFPTTPGAFQQIMKGGALYGDAFVTKLNVGARHEGGCDRNDDSDRAEHQELDRMNQQRSAAMLPPLTMNTTSSNVSRQHDCDDREHGEHSERGSDGSMSGDRLRAAGVLFTVNAESLGLAEGQTADEALASIQSDLVNDATWRANVLNPAFTQVGIGVIYLDGVMFLTEDFTG